MAKERRRSDRGGKASRSATGVGLSAQAGNKASLDDGRRSGRRARRSPLTGRIVARRSACSSELRLVERAGKSVRGGTRFSLVADNATNREESPGGPDFDRGPAKDRATPVLRASAAEECTSPPKFGRHRQVPPTRESGRASPSGTSVGIDGSAGARERASVITVRKRRILPGRGMGREALVAVEIA